MNRGSDWILLLSFGMAIGFGSLIGAVAGALSATAGLFRRRSDFWRCVVAGMVVGTVGSILAEVGFGDHTASDLLLLPFLAIVGGFPVAYRYAMRLRPIAIPMDQGGAVHMESAAVPTSTTQVEQAVTMPNEAVMKPGEIQLPGKNVLSSQVFLSYASPDSELARALADALRREGWSVWWDRTIPPGRSFDEVIESALGAAKCVVVLWSEKSVRSDWVKNEAREGLRRHVLIPALIAQVTIPFEFRHIQAADLVGWPVPDHAGFRSLVDSIQEMTRAAERTSFSN